MGEGSGAAADGCALTGFRNAGYSLQRFVSPEVPRMVARPFLIAALVLSLAEASDARLTVLTTGKVARFKATKGTVAIGKDPALADGPAPTCPTASAIELSSYPQATQRVAVATSVTLDCAKWRRKGRTYLYDDPAATGGVRRITYGRKGVLVRFQGDGFTAPVGPVGYLQLWLRIGEIDFNARVHNFVRNTATKLVTSFPSKDAARGEAAFWAVLHHDWATLDEKATLEQTALDCLTRAAVNFDDPWSRFLLAMMHLYRFGQMTGSYDVATDAAQAELELAHTSFEKAVPELWDGTTGDSRVPGFAAAAKFGLGIVRNDPALQAEGLADIDASIAVNSFFNVFDLIPVVQAMPPSDPRFASAFAYMSSYLEDPDTLACLGTQPEICSNAGYAPRNTGGTLMLFGDLYAKAGNLAEAQRWYSLAAALVAGTPSPYVFQSALDDRVANAAERVALYQDADPSNDPLVIGAGAEACASCHNR